uniref:Uncharacterized protein n=1 Tax=Parascaris equorum TaxID=6256 RepID=A0A914RQH7_PAREQ
MTLSTQSDTHHHHHFTGKSMKIDHDGVRYMNAMNEEMKSPPSIAIKQERLFHQSYPSPNEFGHAPLTPESGFYDDFYSMPQHSSTSAYTASTAGASPTQLLMTTNRMVVMGCASLFKKGIEIYDVYTYTNGSVFAAVFKQGKWIDSKFS